MAVLRRLGHVDKEGLVTLKVGRCLRAPREWRGPEVQTLPLRRAAAVPRCLHPKSHAPRSPPPTS